MRKLLEKVLTNASVTTSSVVIPADQTFAASVIAVVTGTTPVGTLVLEASNDIVATPAVPPTNFAVIGTVSISATGVVIIPKVDICYEWLRVTFTKTSGTVGVTALLKTSGI